MESSRENFFLGRQPILDRSQVIIGYELLFRAAERNVAEFESHSQACTSVISSALANFGIQEVLGDKLGFINIPHGVLLSEMLEVLPVEQTVLELLEDIRLDEQVLERCRELKSIGFQLALDDHEYSDAYNEVYAVIDIVKIDILQTGMEALPAVVKGLRRTPVRILAEKVETVEQFEVCYRLGFDLFQGYFFERPVVLNRKRIDDSGMAMLKLLQQLSVDASLEEIEQTFKENPGLSYNLLRLVNSVALGMREKIKTLRHAILMLGTENLRRWTQLSLFAGADSRGINNPLLEMAAVRGRLMESLVMKRNGLKVTDELSEEAFMTGILSLLEVLFETPMVEIISHLNLTEEVTGALLHRAGQLGSMLTLAEKLELTDFEVVMPLAAECRVSLEQILDAQLDSFNWRAGIVAR
jgi:c-di-GMP-related signal transduction protein